MAKPTTGMLVDGVFASEVIDSSGEIVSIEGMDITTMEEGQGVANYEHMGEEGGGFGREVVGKIVYVRKIFKESDCENDRQRTYWSKLKGIPFLYGVVRLYDGAGHEGAKALAAAIRDHVANSEPILVRYSIEGTTTKKDGNRIERCIAKKVALTWRPCNKTCDSGLLSDPNAPADFPAVKKAEGQFVDPEFAPLGGATAIECNPCVDPKVEASMRLLAAAMTIRAVKKALTAGCYDAAPSTLTGGAALQREDVARTVANTAKATLRDYGWGRPFRRAEFRAFAKAKLPEVSDGFIDHFTDVAEAISIKKALIKREAAAPKPKAARTPRPKAPAVVVPPEHQATNHAVLKELPDHLDHAPDETIEGEGGKMRNLAAGTFRGKKLKPNFGLVRPEFDPKKGVLHTPVGSFKAYLPKQDGAEADANYQRVLSHPDIERAMDTAMGHWTKVHKLAKAGKLPPEVVMHAVLFAQLSPNCLDAETEALTQRGWIKGFDLNKEDVLLTKNAATGRLEWQQMTDLKLFPDYEGPLVEIASRSFRVVTTPDHRWLVTNGRGRVVEKTSATITDFNDKIHRTGEYLPAVESALTPDEAELLGWFVTDGYYRRANPQRKLRRDMAFLCQSPIGNPEKCTRIHALVARLAPDGESTCYVRPEKWCWRLGRRLTDKLLALVPDRTLKVQVLTRLDRAALERLKEAMLLGDGTQGRRLYTGRLEQAEAFQALVSMTGGAASLAWRDMSKYEPRSEKLSNVPKMTGIYDVTIQKRQYARIEPQHRREFVGKVPVWCPMVPNTFFVARRDGQVFVTGNTPVPTQELQFARLVDAMKQSGIDPRRPGFDKILPHIQEQDKPDALPETGREAFRSNPAYYHGGRIGAEYNAEGQRVGKPSEATGRMLGDLLSAKPLLNDKIKNMAKYHTLHDGLVELMGRHKHDMVGAVKELMDSKTAATNWANVRRAKIKAGKPDPGPYKGASIPGLKVKTGLYTWGMLGGGNSAVPDTHFIRNMFGLDLVKDKDTLEYMKNLMWRPTNMHVMEGFNNWYRDNHPAVQYTLNHPKWGSTFERPDDALFPAFWRHWLTIQPHEHFLGMPNRSEQAGTDHAPFWEAIAPHIDPLLKGDLDSSIPLRTALVHQQYVKDYGEVPAMYLYFHHLVPKLLEAAGHRERFGRDMGFLAKARQLEAGLIELRKSIDEAVNGPEAPRLDVHRVDLAIGGRRHPAGRFIIHNNRVHHLEDYHGLLEAMLPEGPLDAQAVSRLHGLRWSPNLQVSAHSPAPEQPAAGPNVAVTSEAPPPARPPVFEYHRPGMLQPHVVEFGPHGAAIDGKRLTDGELALIHDNVANGIGTLRYKKLAQAEAGPADLSKAEPDDMDMEDVLQHMRQAHAEGRLHPDPAVSQRILNTATQFAMEDPMTQMGNKYAFGRFRAKNKPGVYISGDLTDFKAVNDTHGHDAGDEAIKAMGQAFRNAASRVGTIKSWRPGGDETAFYAPTYEDALTFVRHARSELDKLTPVNGVHKISGTFGIGHNFETADKALYEAKKGKIDKHTGMRAFPVGKVPHLAHSLYPGQEGPVSLHHEDVPAQHLPLKQEVKEGTQ